MKGVLAVIMSVASLLVLLPASWSATIDLTSPFLDESDSKTISMDFENAALVDVLKIFSQQTEMNLITAESVSDIKVTVYLDHVPVKDALEQILKANNLTYQIQPGSNIYIIKPMPSVDVEVITRVYQLQNASVQSAQINALLEIDGVSDLSADNNIVSALESILTSKGRIKEDPRTNSLIVTDIATNFPIIEQTIARLDIPVPQILIEVEMLEVAKSVSDKAGIEWTGAFLTLTGGSKLTPFPFDGSIPFIEDPGPMEYEDSRITTGTLDASGLGATLRFLKSSTDTKNLARPTILTLNNQAAEIAIVTDEAISVQQSTPTDTQNNITFTQYDAERVETGVSLIVSPQANTETGIITMAVFPKVTLAKAGTDFGLGTAIRDPEERSAQAMLKVQSGDTIIIGGLMREDITEVNKKIPLLGDIPILGKPFRYRDIQTSERELLIFITPHIIPEPGARIASEQQARNFLREHDKPENY